MNKKKSRYQLLIGLPAILVSVLPIITCPLCWPLYTTILTAMGVGFINSTFVLLPLISVLILFALVGYFIKARKSKNYWPLAIGFLAGLAMIIGKFLFLSDWILWTGMGGYVLASLLHYFSPANSKNKFCSKDGQKDCLIPNKIK